MATAALEVISKAIQALATDKQAPTLTVLDLVLLGSTVGIKIVLYFLCRVVPGTSARALAVDHRNDCVSNSVAMFTAWFGATHWDPADAVGAILIGLFIIITWCVIYFPLSPLSSPSPLFSPPSLLLCPLCRQTHSDKNSVAHLPQFTHRYIEGREHVLNLAGRGASPQFIQQLTW